VNLLGLISVPQEGCQHQGVPVWQQTPPPKSHSQCDRSLMPYRRSQLHQRSHGFTKTKRNTAALHQLQTVFGLMWGGRIIVWSETEAADRKWFDVGGNYMPENFIRVIYTLYQILLLWLNQGLWDGWDLWHVWGGGDKKVLVEKPCRKRPLGSYKRRW
jgi:hypothetical protein